LRERLSLGAPIVHKDLSLVSLIPKWPGSESATTLEDFIASVEAAARIGRWQDRDCFEIALLKLTDAAKVFYQGCAKLHTQEVSWQTFKEAFRQRFKDVHTDYPHYMSLQTARQGKNESPQEFADRCRALAQKIICRVDDPIAQRVHQENVERMLLASFVAGLGGEAGHQARFSDPRTVQYALRIALSVQEAERQDKFSNSFFTKFDRSVSPQSRSPGQTYSVNDRQRYSGDWRPSSRTSGHRPTVPKSAGRPTGQDTRNARTKVALRYQCEGIGYFARKCPTKLRREQSKSRPSEKRSQFESSRRSESPTGKPPFPTKRGSRTGKANSGN
jgi:hypothetical protein